MARGAADHHRCFHVQRLRLERPKAEVGSTLAPGSDYQFGSYEIYDYPGEFADTAQADTQVKLRLQAETTQHDIVRGEGNARSIHSGSLFSMVDFPRADQNKEYLVFSTSISIRSPSYEFPDRRH